MAGASGEEAAVGEGGLAEESQSLPRVVASKRNARARVAAWMSRSSSASDGNPSCRRHTPPTWTQELASAKLEIST
jgi:hypothetical protein